MKRMVVSFLVSYDAELLKKSVPLIYKEADLIVFSIDRDQLTWQGQKYELADDFTEWIDSLDIAKKVIIYKDKFYLPGVNPNQLDTRQRQMTAEYAGMSDTWHIQVDADEYILNFADLINNLRREERERKVCEDVLYMGKLIPLFKQDSTGFYYVDNGNSYELVALAASNPTYTSARKTNVKEQKVFDVYVIHQTFARDEDELIMKLQNWTHSNDFDTQSYLNLWRVIDQNNYKYLYNFHPSYAPTWKRLAYTQASNINKFIDEYTLRLDKLRISTDHYTPRKNILRYLIKNVIRRFLAFSRLSSKKE